VHRAIAPQYPPRCPPHPLAHLRKPLSPVEWLIILPPSFFVPVLHGLYQRGLILGAFRDGSLAGVCGMARPGLCQPTSLEKLTVIPSVVFGNPLTAPMRVLKWAGEWARRDPSEPHWHLGPVAADSHVQGQGIGRAMLTEFCARVDRSGGLSNLETDKPENVRFYQKFGFTVIAEAEILRVPNWFMSRSRG
jgi:ribosomal protein S18 acetylase RimI-like enzyme